MSDEAPQTDLVVGDLVIVPYARVRAQLGCSEEVGLVLEDRPHVVKVYWPAMDRMFWLERDVLERIEHGRLPLHPLVDRLHLMGQLVELELIEIYDGTLKNGVVHLYGRGMAWEQALAARTLLGDAVAAVSIEPANMRRLRWRIEWGSTPSTTPYEPEAD